MGLYNLGTNRVHNLNSILFFKNHMQQMFKENTLHIFKTCVLLFKDFALYPSKSLYNKLCSLQIKYNKCL